jgi:transcription elongation factor GreA
VTVTADTVWLTPAALAKLRAEHDGLAARQTELTSDERARLAELKDLIRTAQAEPKPDDGLVEPGMRITVRFDDDGSTASFVFGSRTMLGLDESLDVDVYSPQSPLGAAIDGLYVGDTASFESPKGLRKLTIVAASPAA